MDGGMNGGYWGDVGRGVGSGDGRAAGSALGMTRGVAPAMPGYGGLPRHVLGPAGLPRGDDGAASRSTAEHMQQLCMRVQYAAQQRHMAAMLPYASSALHGGSALPYFGGVGRPAMAAPQPVPPTPPKRRARPAPKPRGAAGRRQQPRSPPAKPVPQARKLAVETREVAAGEAAGVAKPAPVVRDRVRNEGYGVTVLSMVAGRRFARNNGRNSKNIQGFPHVAESESPTAKGNGAARRRRRRVPGLRARVTCPSEELLATAVVTMTIVPDAVGAGSAWARHECSPGTRECDVVPVYAGMPEAPARNNRDSDGEAGDADDAGGTCPTPDGFVSRVFVFYPRHVWWYNHAMKKNLGARRELHCLKVRACGSPRLAW